MTQATERADTVSQPKFFPDGEMKALLGEEENSNTRSSAISRASERAENAVEQVRKIRQENPEFYDQYLKPLCEEEIEERILRLEDRVQTLEANLEDTENADD